MDEELQEQGALIELSEVKGIVRRRRWEFLIPCFLGWLLVWGISWLIPSTYHSGTLILVEQPSVPEKYVVSNIDIDIQQQLDSISQQILSRTRLLRIIEKLNLYAPDRKRLSDDEIVEKMRKDIDIELVRGDDKKLSAFNIFYDSRDAKTAQSAVSELADLFIKENLEQRQRRSENTTNFLEDQLEQARQKLALQEAKVREFKDRHAGELPTQTQSNIQILTGLQSQLQAAENDLNRARQQNTYLESLINQYRAMGSAAPVPGSSGNGLAVVDKELQDLRAQLADLTARYTEKHPDVKKTKEKIAQAERVRERMVANLNSGAGNGDSGTNGSSEPKSAALLELESQLKANRVEIANRQASIKELQRKIGEYQGRLNMVPVMEQQFADITRDYDQSKADYESLLKKKNESEMATDLEKTQQGEHFRMIDPPNFPTKPAKPKRLIFLAFGLVAGLVLGGANALATDWWGGKVYSERDIKRAVPFDIIAEIPKIETAAEQVVRKRNAWIAASAAAGMAACILLGAAITYFYG